MEAPLESQKVMDVLQSSQSARCSSATRASMIPCFKRTANSQRSSFDTNRGSSEVGSIQATLKKLSTVTSSAAGSLIPRNESLYIEAQRRLDRLAEKMNASTVSPEDSKKAKRASRTGSWDPSLGSSNGLGKDKSTGSLDPECSFRPTLYTRSRNGRASADSSPSVSSRKKTTPAESTKEDSPAFLRLYERQKNSPKTAELRATLEAEELKQATFKPQLFTKHQVPNNGEAVHNRLYNKARAEQRSPKSEEVDSDCTFKPKLISKSPRGRAETTSKSHDYLYAQGKKKSVERSKLNDLQQRSVTDSEKEPRYASPKADSSRNPSRTRMAKPSTNLDEAACKQRSESNIWDRLALDRRKVFEARELERARAEEQNCTFRPAIGTSRGDQRRARSVTPGQPESVSRRSSLMAPTQSFAQKSKDSKERDPFQLRKGSEKDLKDIEARGSAFDKRSTRSLRESTVSSKLKSGTSIVDDRRNRFDGNAGTPHRTSKSVDSDRSNSASKPTVNTDHRAATPRNPFNLRATSTPRSREPMSTRRHSQGALSSSLQCSESSETPRQKKTPSGAKGERFKSPLTARKTDVDSACPQSATKRTPAHKKPISRQSPTAPTEESSAADNNNIVEGSADQHTEDQPQEKTILTQSPTTPTEDSSAADNNNIVEGSPDQHTEDQPQEGLAVPELEDTNDLADGLQALTVNDVVIEGDCVADKQTNENTDELMDGMQAMTVNDSVGEGAVMAETNETETF